MKESSLITLIVVSMIILVIISLSVLWFFYYLQNKNIKLRMLAQENKINYQNQLLVNTVKTQETERTRISAELHDDVASRLNVMHLNIHLLKKNVSASPDVVKIIDQLESSLGESIERTRTISHELMPQLLKKFGFHHALHDLAQSINATGRLLIEINDGYMLPHFANNLEELHLFRIVQELVNNTIKYAQASTIRISFEKEATTESVIMIYTDDGIGFDPDLVQSGLGLNNIKTRAELLNAKWEFLPAREDGGGVQFTLKFKYNG